MLVTKQLLPRLLLLPCESFFEEVLLGTLETESYLCKENASLVVSVTKSPASSDHKRWDTLIIGRM